MIITHKLQEIQDHANKLYYFLKKQKINNLEVKKKHINATNINETKINMGLNAYTRRTNTK